MRTVIVAVLLVSLAGCCFPSVKGGNQAKPEQPKPTEPEFNQTATVGKVRVDLTGMIVSQDGRFAGNDQFLTINFKVVNAGDKKRVAYTRWAYDVRGSNVTLQDDCGNGYRVQNTQAEALHLKLPEANIDPGFSAEDSLTFDKPVAVAKWFKLTLPAKRVGESGDFVFKFSAGQVNHK